ncbi:PQQ-binding-like beta-propeller repeat protein [bacterium]|nr:PQQ-binding-like beta-propeller repeat protein [bacterium]
MFRLGCILWATLVTSALGADWPQGPGSNFDFTVPRSDAPSAWSVSLDQNIAWRTKLPETGQSTPVILGDRIFITTMKPVEADSKTGNAIVAWCLSAEDGSVLWQHEIPGGYPSRLSAPFGDASSAAAVTDGKHVWFLNPTGRLACFDMDGNRSWSKEAISVDRTRPILFEGKLIFHRQVYMPNAEGTFNGPEKGTGIESWTQLQALDAETGDLIWTSECGANMGCVPLLQKLDDGTPVMVVGRGGGHHPPETPEGISLIRADNGKTLWTLELPQYMSTQTYPIVGGHALVFHKGDHLWVNAKTGKIDRQVSIVKNVPVRQWSEGGRESVVENLPDQKARSITQQSNLRVGNYHYFRSYTRNYLGRVNITTGKVEYLELPLQVLREPGQAEQVLWLADVKGKNPLAATLRPNAVKNSRGFVVMGDKRSVQNGWGHTASPIPTAFGNRLFVPILSGMVFAIQADAEVLDEKAILSINDLGPLGESFTRASISTDGTRAYGHTIKELIAIEQK